MIPSTNTVKTKHKELWELLQDPNSIGVTLSRADAEQLINEYQKLKKENV